MVKTINGKLNVIYSPRFKPWAIVLNLYDFTEEIKIIENG